MDRVTGTPPPRVARDLAILRDALQRSVPAKLLDRNLLISTWRWPMFDAVNDTWIAEPEDATKRDLRAVRCLAEIVAHFDVTAIQGVMGDGRRLQLVMDALGDHWALMVTGLSRESTYNERTAFIFDMRKVHPRGLVGQVVLRQGEKSSGRDMLSSQFFRPPLFAAFRCLDRDFTLANIHMVFGKPAERVAEMRAFVGWLKDVEATGGYWERNMIALGQLQLVRSSNEIYAAFVGNGLFIPDDLVDVPTFVNSTGRPATMASSVAWFGDRTGPAGGDLGFASAGVFNFLAPDLPFVGALPTDYISDHLPVWVEFGVRRGDRSTGRDQDAGLTR